jgi:hypothetical protein
MNRIARIGTNPWRKYGGGLCKARLLADGRFYIDLQDIQDGGVYYAESSTLNVSFIFIFTNLRPQKEW